MGLTGQSVWPASGRRQWIPLAVLALMVPSALLLGSISASPRGVALVAALAALIAICAIPVQVLPAVVVGSFALFPWSYLGIAGLAGQQFFPPLFVLIIFFVRTATVKRTVSVGLTGLLAAGLLVWTVISTLLSIDIQKSAFTMAGLAAVTVTVLRPQVFTERARELARITWFGSAVIAGSLAVVESVIGHGVLDPVFRLFRNTALIDQHWSVFRVTTTLGHPLMNGTFFAVTAAFSAFVLMKSWSRLTAAALAASVIGLVLSVSRGSTIALVAGFGVGLALSIFARSYPLKGRLAGVVLVGLGAAVVLGSPLLAERSTTKEGQGSAEFRDTILVRSLDLLRANGYRGTGPGTGSFAFRDAVLDKPLENSVLSFAVGAGIVGLVLLLALLGAFLIRNARHGEAASAAAIVAFLVASASWNYWDVLPVASWIFVVTIVVVSDRPSARAAIRPPKAASPPRVSAAPTALDQDSEGVLAGARRLVSSPRP